MSRPIDIRLSIDLRILFLERQVLLWCHLDLTTFRAATKSSCWSRELLERCNGKKERSPAGFLGVLQPHTTQSILLHGSCCGIACQYPDTIGKYTASNNSVRLLSIETSGTTLDEHLIVAENDNLLQAGHVLGPRVISRTALLPTSL